MELLGKSAEELGELRDSDEQAYDLVFQQANFKEYIFRVRAKMDTYNVSGLWLKLVICMES